MATDMNFQSLVQGFFIEWLDKGRNVSPNTVASYRDAFSLYLRWLYETNGVDPIDISMDDFTPNTIMGFLAYLREGKGCAANTVNCRLAAFKSFCRYASYKAPERMKQFQGIEQIPDLKVRKKEIDYLTPEEVGWLLESCKERIEDALLISLLYNTGARISEIIVLKACDVSISEFNKCRIKILGKGRKERTLPLWEDTSELLLEHMRQNSIRNNGYLFSGRHVEHLTRSGARSRIAAVVKSSTDKYPKLKEKKITPHVFRHSTAMSMLAAGIDIATVAIWLGHEQIDTTHKYVVSDMKLKEQALEKAKPEWRVKPRRAYEPNKGVLEFLQSL